MGCIHLLDSGDQTVTVKGFEDAQTAWDLLKGDPSGEGLKADLGKPWKEVFPC